MTEDTEVKQNVRQFYDQVGWQEVEGGVYQNALFEDLRPVSQAYVHRCHMRIPRHIRPRGRFLLDAGSGPVQYPEYQTYSQGYDYRVCADISIVALQEARQRIGDHGLFVVADVANLPFKREAFEGVVSMHTIHHLPPDDHLQAYDGLYRVLAPGCAAAVVNGWQDAPLMKFLKPLVRLSKRARRGLNRRLGQTQTPNPDTQPTPQQGLRGKTFVKKYDAAWLKRELGSRMAVEIWVWRSVSVRFMRIFIHRWLGGRLFLWLLFWIEERFPHFFGEKGQYPLIVIRKP